jgi:uncharacterized protein (TIGR02597 family)
MNTPALFHPARLVAFCGALGFAFATPAAAQTVTTVPVGVMTYAIPAGTPAAPSLTAISFQLYDQTPPSQGIGNGIIGAITLNTATLRTEITVTDANWISGALASSSAPYLIRITSGASSGKFFQVTANTSTNLTIPGVNQSGSGFAVGDSFQLIAAETLASFFTGSNALIGGTSASTSDIVYLFEGGSWVGYYRNTSTATPQWLKAVGRSANSDNIILHPEKGFVIQRKSAALNLVLSGVVPNDNFNAPIMNSGSTVTNSGFPVDYKLGTLGLESKLGLIKNASASNADLVSIFQGGSWVSYYHTGSVWKKSVGRSSDEGSVLIAAGTPIIITKRGALANTTNLVINKPY